MSEDAQMPTRNEAQSRPPPTADRILDQILWGEFLRQMPKRSRLIFLRNVTARVSAQSDHGNIVRFGEKSDEAKLAAASKAAAELWRHMLTVLLRGSA